MVKNMLKSKQGFQMIELLTIVALVATIAITIIPKINTALENRINYGSEIINHVDTTSEIEN